MANVIERHYDSHPQGEAYVDEATSRQLLETAEKAVRAGVQVEIRKYFAA